MVKATNSWIFVRGLGREKGHWGPFLDEFRAKFPDDEILAVDLPGAGEYNTQTSPMSLKEIFRFVRAKTIEQSQAQGKFKILAVSLGAMVAMEWMRQKPEDLSGCVLINSSTKSSSHFYQRLRWQVWPEVLRLASIQSAKERERGILALIMNNPEARDSALPLWTRIALERPVSVANFTRQLTAAALYKAGAMDHSVPTLLLNGLGDRLVDPACSTRLHEVYGWPIHRHPWAGHDLPWDDSKWVIDQVSEWAKTL